MCTDTALLEASIDEDELIEFTRKLIQTHAANEEGRGESAVAKFLLAKMAQWGWDADVFDSDGRPNVTVIIEGGGGPGPTLAFEGHLDVVTEGERSQWTVDPFGAEVRAGRLYGRGAADMKSGVAAMMYAARALQLAGPFPGRIRLLLLADEEGMMRGAKTAVASGIVRDVDGVICCEPEGDEICPVSKGALRLRIDFAGRMCHGAMPSQGINTLPALARVLVGLETLETHGAEDAAVPSLESVSISPTVVQAGSADQMNTIPGTSLLYLDVRTPPRADHADLVARIAEFVTEVSRQCGVGSAVSVIDDRPWVETPVQEWLVACLISAHQVVNGAPPVLGWVPGTTDGTILSHLGRLPTVVYGPGGKWIAHKANEYVVIADLKRYALTYAIAADLYLADEARSPQGRTEAMRPPESI